MNRIREIAEHGQSIWYDYIQRGMIWTGALYRMMEEDGLKGVTSNPAIFEKAISKSRDYRAALEAVVRMGASPLEAFERLAVEDIQLACDVLRKVYDDTEGKDGFVSLEVSPHLANDTIATIEDALRLWDAVSRENLMIKIPATTASLPAIEQVIAEGVNVNVTLLFSVDRYVAAAQAYMNGLERFVGRGGDPRRVASVASFFVSRIDSLVDKKIDERLATATDAQKKMLGELKGKVAVANAKRAYVAYEKLMAEGRWKKLAEQGARPQRLLWASTSTKNPAYRDVLYVEELIGPDTVNTVPEATYEAMKEHGRVEPDRIRHDRDGAEQVLAQLAEADISLDAVTDQLLDEGVALFAQAFDRLMGAVAQRRTEILGARLPVMTASLGVHEAAVETRLAEADRDRVARRLWERDPTLWSDRAEDAEAISGFMGWLDIVEEMEDHPEHLLELQEELEAEGIKHVVVLGMGGSSLAPDVFARTFGPVRGSPQLHVLDSTVPAQIRALEKKIDLDETIFIVASKSGTTSEPLAFEEYFFDKVGDGERFLGVTDPDTPLCDLAEERGYRQVFLSDPEIGGRYSALSPFGMVPAACMGADVMELLGRAHLMEGSCEAAVPARESPGVRLGTTLGTLAAAGRDKLTLITSSRLSAFGSWLEQLIAESTGKAGKGIVPIDREPLAAVEKYGDDRVFAYLALAGDEDAHVSAQLAALEQAGHPVLRFVLAEPEDLVQEMFRWEIATAAAAHVLGINPFDQPNVQESKSYTKSLLASHAKNGKLPAVEGEKRLFEDQGVTVYASAADASALGGAKDLSALLAAHLGRVQKGDYVALNAFVEMSDANEGRLTEIRTKIRDAHHVATTVGFGPRFLHSTGQLHKGGANTGVFLQITCDDPDDLEVPNAGYTFGVLKTAQQAGDFMALAAQKRRIVRLHLGNDVAQGLKTILEALS